MVLRPHWRGNSRVLAKAALLSVSLLAAAACRDTVVAASPACEPLDGLLAFGRWYGAGSPVVFDVDDAGAAEIRACSITSRVAAARATEGEVRWDFDWLDTGGAFVRAGWFEGTACEENVSGTFDFGGEVTFRQSNEHGCCACE